MFHGLLLLEEVQLQLTRTFRAVSREGHEGPSPLGNDAHSLHVAPGVNSVLLPVGYYAFSCQRPNARRPLISGT